MVENWLAMDATAKIARFLATTRYEDLPASAIQTAKTAIQDTAGAMLAGARADSGHIAAQLAREEAARPEATIFGQGFRSSAIQAAFANGVAAHAEDFDYSFVLAGQPMAPIVPAVLAVAETLGASGKQLIEAFAAGFEVTASLAFAVKDMGVWHANGVLGAFGAMAACAKLLGLDDHHLTMAIGITASMASGLTANFGTMSKPLHVGLAARNGVHAAQLARAGFTSNPDTLEARNGFFAAHFPGCDIDPAPFDAVGREWALDKHGIRLKPYPCGGLTHSALYAAMELCRQHGIAAEDVEQVDVDVPPHTYQTIAFRVPETAIQGKFSMPYLIARAIVDGTIALGTFTEEAVREPQVLALLDKVTMRSNADLVHSADGSRPSVVTIRLRTGQTHTMHGRFAPGSPQLPMTEQQMEAKFRDCAAGVISNEACDQALAELARLDILEDVSTLTQLLNGSGA
jgi:2-methylcitrate dehydratase PrpD